MKEIQPIQTWCNGGAVEASLFSLTCNQDNLNSNASFAYTLFSIDSNNIIKQLQNGFILMDGEDYIKWETNEYAYNWAANKLNLTIIGDYIPPAPPVPVPPIPDTTEPNN